MIYNFDPHQDFVSIDNLPDHRSEEERLNSLLSVYNHQNPDIAYGERLAEEMINLSGAWITVFRRTKKDGHKDEIWEENADPTYRNGIKLKGRFAPQPAEVTLNKFGVDLENKTTIQFSRASVFKTFGKDMIAEGDILIVPHNTLTVVQSTDLRDGPLNRVDTYRVLKANDIGNFKYRWLYWACTVENVTGDKSIQVDFRQEQS